MPVNYEKYYLQFSQIASEMYFNSLKRVVDLLVQECILTNRE